MATSDTNNDNFTYEDLIDEISAFLEANKDISELEFQCLLEQAFNTGNDTNKSCQKVQDVSAKVSEKNSSKKKTWFPIKFFFLFLCIVPGILLVSYASNQSIPKAIYKVAASHFDLPPYLDLYYYLFLRPIRAFSIFLNLPKLEALPECYLPNPFLPSEEMPEMFADECKCQNTKYILAASLNTTKTEDSVNLNADFLADQPILLKQWGTKITVKILRDILRRSGQLLSEVPNTVTSNHGTVSSMKQFVNMKTFDVITKNTSLHLKWLSSHYIGCSVIKELFPLHLFVKNHYFDTGRILHIDGSTSDAYELSQPKNTYISAYIQGAGSRKIILSPKFPCENRCRYLSARLDAGDIMLFAMSAYSARSEHVDKSISLSSVVSLDDGDSDFAG